MDNDNQVRDSDFTHRSVRLFLGDELKPLEHESAPAYDLVAEYAKTRRSRNRRVWLLLALCFAVVGLSALGVTLVVSRVNQRIAVSINTFDDLNLRVLLSTVGRTQSLYESALKEKASLQEALDAELQLAAQKLDNDLFTIQSVVGVSTPALIRRRSEAVQREYQETVARVRERFAERIQAAEEDMHRYAEQLDGYDSGELNQAQRQEAVIDSQKQLHDLEMQAQASRYEQTIAELRQQMAEQQAQAAKAQHDAVEEVRSIYQAKIDELDPFVRDRHGRELVQAALVASLGASGGEELAAPATFGGTTAAVPSADGAALPTAADGAAVTGDAASAVASAAAADSLRFSAADYASEANASAVSLLASLQATEQDFADFDYVTQIVAAIPQERDIPAYVQAMKRTAYKIGTELAQAAGQVQQEADGLRSLVAQYEGALAAFTRDTQCDGIVLDTSDRSALPLYLSAAAERRVAQGATVAQLRDGGRTLASVTIQRRNERYVAVPDSATAAPQPIAAFTALYLQDAP